MLDPATINHQATIAAYVILGAGLLAIGVHFWRRWRKGRR